MTRLVCMYGGHYPTTTILDPRVKDALERWAPRSGLEVEYIDTTDDLQIYADEMEKRWTGKEDLIIVEQDKEVHSGCFPSFLNCPEPWCGYTFWQNPEPYTALVLGGFGVVKFSAEVQTWFPVSAFRGESQIHIDRRFYDYLLENHSKGCHLHGHVIHHHVYEPRPKPVREHVKVLQQRGWAPPPLAPTAPAPHLLPGSYDLDLN